MLPKSNSKTLDNELNFNISAMRRNNDKDELGYQYVNILTSINVIK